MRKAEKKAAGATTDLAAYWQSQAQSLQKELTKVRKDQIGLDVLLSEVRALAPLSYSPVGTPPALAARRAGGSPQSAVLMLSDTHIGQVTHPEQTLELGGYNFNIFLHRLKRLEKSIFSIVQDHTTTPINEIVAAILGDMIHGNLTHAVEAGQVNTLFTQFYNAGHAIAQFLRNVSVLAPVRVKTAVGNHPRWGTQRKMPTDNRYSNLDQFLYAYIAALVRDVPRITFELNQQPFSLFDIQGHQFYAGHGDHMRGGDRILGVPNHAIGRNLSNTSQLFNAANKKFPNYFLFGHFHRPITLPHCAGEVLINGGFPGLDGFALMEAFNSSKPSQKFFLVHKTYGKAASYDIKLESPEESNPKAKLPYELPAGFPAK